MKTTLIKIYISFIESFQDKQLRIDFVVFLASICFSVNIVIRLLQLIQLSEVVTFVLTQLYGFLKISL